MSDHAESRFTVLAEGFDDAVVAVTVGVVGLERRHQLGIYTKANACVNGYFDGIQRGSALPQLGIYRSRRLNSLSRNDLAEIEPEF